MSANRKILRGDDWAVELQDRLHSLDGNVTAWMVDNTRLLKRDSTSVVGLMQLERGQCCLKLYRYQSVLRRGLLSLGHGRPVRSFDTGQAMATRGLPVARPLACLQVADGGLLLTEGIAGARDMQSLWRAEPDDTRRRQLLLGSVDALVRLHQSAYAHGDCKWSNLLCNGERWWLVDLDAATKASPGSGRQARDLARYILNAEEMAVSAADFDLFLNSYLQGTGQSRQQVLGQVMPPLRKLRARHLARYGPRGEPLL